MIILIGGEKGGTGKSTLAINLAVLRARAGRDVLLLDADGQGSAAAWAQTRDTANITPRIPCVQGFGKELAKQVRDLATRYQDIVIDAGGRDSVELRSAMLAADVLYSPIQASQLDIWTLETLDGLVAQALAFNVNLKAFAVINRASTNPLVNESKEAEEVFRDFENIGLAKTVVRERIAFRKAIMEGRAVVELNSADPKANNEIISLSQEIFEYEQI